MTGRELAAASFYGSLVFGGTALTGLAIAPALAIASGYYAIEEDARYALSLMTLRAIPWLLGMSVLSGALYPRIAAWRVPARAALLVGNTVAVWLVGAAISLAILG